MIIHWIYGVLAAFAFISYFWKIV